MTARNWCFTINNPAITDDLFETWNESQNVKFGIMQLEIGTAGTLHLQGYVEFIQPIRLAAVKKLSATAHWEIRQGNRNQAIIYASKEETRCTDPAFPQNQWIFGTEMTVEDYVATLTTNPKSHSSKDLEELKGMILNGKTELELANHNFNAWSRHYRALERYRMLCTTARTEPTEVIVVVGPTGTGKSKYAMEFSNSYWKQKSIWWDGYSGQETVVLDEFYGWLPYDTLLRLCDRYPLLVETKGGQTQFTSKRIIITSNTCPSKWYKDCYFPALCRRISKFIVMPKLDTKLEFTNYEDASVIMEALYFNKP